MLPAELPQGVDPLPRGARAVVSVRPERVHIDAPGTDPAPEMVAAVGRVLQRTFLGDQPVDVQEKILWRNAAALYGLPAD